MIKFKEGKLPKNLEDRLKYLYRFQELLRLFHNEKGKQAEDGKITIKTFRDFQKGWFLKYSSLICDTINDCKEKLSKEDKERLLESDEKCPDSIGSAKDKEKWKKDYTIIVNIEDIEDDE